MWVLHEVLQNFNKLATIEKIEYYSPAEFNKLYKKMSNLVIEIGLRNRMVKKLDDILNKAIVSRVKNPITKELLYKSHQELMDRLKVNNK